LGPHEARTCLNLFSLFVGCLLLPQLCQTHYVATKAHAFADGAPILIVGDTNSQPGSAVHEYFWKGRANAKSVAPWYNRNSFRWVKQDGSESDQLEEQFHGMSVDESPDGPPQVRYLLDFTLNRLCRWLRILGIDAGLETEDEERMRTKEGK